MTMDQEVVQLLAKKQAAAALESYLTYCQNNKDIVRYLDLLLQILKISKFKVYKKFQSHVKKIYEEVVKGNISEAKVLSLRLSSFCAAEENYSLSKLANLIVTATTLKQISADLRDYWGLFIVNQKALTSSEVVEEEMALVAKCLMGCLKTENRILRLFYD